MLSGVFAARGSEKSATQFLRFYENGYVIACTIAGVANAPSWFDWSHEGVQRGRYELQGEALWFETFSPAGSVVYRGRVSGPTIELSSVSLINGFEQTLRFDAL